LPPCGEVDIERDQGWPTDGRRPGAVLDRL